MNSDPTTAAPSGTDQLAASLGESWPGISAARAKTEELRGKLARAIQAGDLDDLSCAVVVTGSLGRKEANDGSDADWILLVDGPSTPDHAKMARDVTRCVAECSFKKEGPTGTFGTIVASHSLVHHIAGIHDTNENLTRRMLLLAESWAVSGELVRERVLRNVLARYVLHDRSVPSSSPDRRLIPHFLLNDVVRYWRTIASDYASKMWERDAKGWATRNVKLRFSRKLLFVWGLLASFSGQLFPTPQMQVTPLEQAEVLTLLSDLIREQTDVSPLDLLAKVALQGNVQPSTSKQIFAAYDAFLFRMSEQESRERLDSLPFKDAENDPVYSELRERSRQFRTGLESLFFDEHPQLKNLVRQFGVF